MSTRRLDWSRDIGSVDAPLPIQLFHTQFLTYNFLPPFSENFSTPINFFAPDFWDETFMPTDWIGENANKQ